jgi:putative hydrolase of the HAD superfamily
MYQAIIFDFFGVIQVDPYQRWLSKHGLKRENAFADASDVADRGQMTQEQFFERLRELTGEPLDEIKAAFFENKTIDEELVKYIAELKQAYKTGLLSNSRGDYLRPILQMHGIAGLFDEIIISSEVGIIKPELPIFNLAVEKIGAPAAEIIFIDDRDYNVVAAETVGVKSILYKDLASLKEDLQKLGVAPLPPR